MTLTFFNCKKLIFEFLKTEAMKSKILFCSLLALSIAFVSCKKEEEAEAAATSTPQQPIMVPVVTPTIRTENYAGPSPQVNMPVQTQQAVVQAPVAKAGMNPAHGQPGHRCDIAVGAPLNSPPAKVAVPKAQGQGSFTTTTIPTPTSGAPTTGTPPFNPQAPAPTPVVTAPGMNPPHGQEGHLCSVAVGAPLPKATESQ
jgi:hypothetical protein